MPRRQKLLILYLAHSGLDGRVVSWAQYDGTGRRNHIPGDTDDPPYETGVHALRDGWRLLQMSALAPHAAGDEFTTSYLKYEFLFERLEEVEEVG